jgi:hypothetical protein
MIKSIQNCSGEKSAGQVPKFLSSPNPSVTRSPMFDPNQILFDHACETMPDSLARRRLVLQAFKVKVHRRHPAYAKICAQLAALEVVCELQAQLQAVVQRPFRPFSLCSQEAVQ